MRQPIVGGNCEMRGTRSEAAALASAVRAGLTGTTRAEAVFCPPFTALRSAQTVIEAARLTLKIGAQNADPHESGAFTGEISPLMLSKYMTASEFNDAMASWSGSI